MEKLSDTYLTYLGEKYVLYPDTLPVLSSLKGKVRQYIVTNGHVKPQTMKIEDSGLIDIVDGVFISDAIGCPKPEKEYFDYCFRKIGNVDKSKTIIIGDSLSSDMKGVIKFSEMVEKHAHFPSASTLNLGIINHLAFLPMQEY